jgi:hypothetical protein
MMPYSHAEDGEGRIYVTLTLAELKEALWTKGANAFRMKAVRVALAPGEALDGTFDCLQVTTCMRDGAAAEEVDTNVQFEAFDFDGLFAKLFRDVRPDVACAVRERLNERAAAA